MSDSNIVPFAFEGKSVRVVERDGEPWFVAKDVCDILSLSNSRKAVAALDDDEKGVTLSYTPGGQQEVGTISESGLYALILRCRDAMKAGTIPHRLRKWVTAEVLPAIRKTGSYNAKPQFAIPQNYAEALELAAKQARALDVALPKAEAYDEFITTNGLLSVAETAKMLFGKSDRYLFDKLRESGWLDRRPNVGNSPRQWVINQGFMTIRPVLTNGRVYSQPVFTPKGIAALRMAVRDGELYLPSGSVRALQMPMLPNA